MPQFSLPITSTTAIAVVATAFACRSAWNSTPDWVKEYFKKKKSPKVKDANDDFANPATIASKLQDMFNLMYKESSDLLPADMPWFKIYVCFISFVHNRTEVLTAHPEFRDGFYRKEGLKLHLSELEVLEEYMEYAEWAYDGSVLNLQDKIRPRAFDLVRLDTATEPGRVGHFILADKATKRIIISIKGTSTISDMLTDLIGVTVEQEVEGKKYRFHEGMYTAAKMMLDDTRSMIEEFFLPAGYSIVVTGHSLGASVACLLGFLLRDAIPALRRNKKLKVYAYATPACMSYDACLACGDFITSVVNNTDCIPRMSVSSMRVLYRFFLQVEKRLQAKGLDPQNIAAAQKYFSDLMVVDTDFIMGPKRYTETADAILATEKPNMTEPYAIFVPGKVVAMWECSESDEHSVDARCGDGGMRVVRCLDITTSMVGDHGTANYRKNLHALVVETREHRKFSG